MQTLVTKESLEALIDKADKAKKKRIIGRAIVAINNYQTAEEQGALETKEHNGVGFTGADARSGTITARYFMRWKTLEDWQYDMWMKKNVRGVRRISKYHAQLNIIANHNLEKENG